MSKHTPTPWAVVWNEYVVPENQLERRIGGSTNKAEDKDQFAHVVCRIDRNSNRFSAEHANANAAFIVKAVNSHDELVKALQKITKEYIRTRAQQDGKKMGDDWSEYENIVCVEAARKALAAAGAK